MSTKLRYLYRAYRYRWLVDPAELRFVSDSLQPGQVAVDVGCHKGAYTYWMRRSVGPSGAVYAFEPQPQQAAYLREAISAMRYDNVVIVPMAVSNKSGDVPLYISTNAGRTHEASLEILGADRGLVSQAITVGATTLDQFFFTGSRREPNFLKIDVEGHELAVLEGARRTLETYLPTVLVECETRHRPDHEVRTVFEFLLSLGYNGSFFSNGVRRPLAEFDAAVHQITTADSDDLPPNYANNFAFVP